VGGAGNRALRLRIAGDGVVAGAAVDDVVAGRPFIGPVAGVGRRRAVGDRLGLARHQVLAVAGVDGVVAHDRAGRAGQVQLICGGRSRALGLGAARDGVVAPAAGDVVVAGPGIERTIDAGGRRGPIGDRLRLAGHQILAVADVEGV